MDYRDNNQIKEQKIYFAMELAKQARENLEDLLAIEVSPSDKRKIQASIDALEAIRDNLRPVRGVYAMLAEMKELLNTSRKWMYDLGYKLNQSRRPTSPHRDPV